MSGVKQEREREGATSQSDYKEIQNAQPVSVSANEDIITITITIAKKYKKYMQ